MRLLCQIDKALPKSVKDSVQYRVGLKLSRFGNVIRALRVTVQDVNGPRGGHDIRCRIRATLLEGKDVVVEKTAASVGEAIANAVDSAQRAILRNCERARFGWRSGRRLQA